MDGALTVSGTMQASSFVSTGAGPWNLTGNFGSLSPAPSGQSMIGFGPNGKLEVSENAGAVVEVAKLDVNGNFAGNATTATALAQAPAQCSGSFAIGVQANGDANCSTADVIQLAETTQPSGVPNYGIFWFDLACHCPKVISNNGQAVQLGLLNVFNADANTLEEYNGTNPQIFRMYGTRTDASNYERIGFKWDNPDGYFAIASENAGTGSQRGIAFLIGSTVRWAVDTASTFKPFGDNSFNVGSATLRPKTYYAGTSFDITNSGALTFEPCNDGTTGTSLNFLAKYNTASSPCALKATTADTDGIIGIVSGGSGTSGNAIVTYRGYAQCSFDGGTTGGDYVVASTSNAADCHDSGTTRPIGAQVIGRVMSTNASAGTYQVFVNLEAPDPGSNLAKSQTCTNRVLEAVDGNATASNCAQITPTLAANVQGNGVAFQLSTGSTINGDFASYDANGNTVDSGVKTASQVPWFTQPTATGTVSFLTSANVAKLYGVLFSNATPLTTTQVTYNVQTADNTANNYDIGLYNTSGTLVAHIGSTAGTSFAPSTGWKTVSWTASATGKMR